LLTEFTFVPGEPPAAAPAEEASDATDDVVADEEYVEDPTYGRPMEMTDTASLLRELSSLGLEDEPPAAPPPPARASNPKPAKKAAAAPKPAAKQKRKGLFGLGG
jgi:hypothetical protein